MTNTGEVNQDNTNSILEALEQGSFQAGDFQRSNDGKLLINPSTGEIVVSGTGNFAEQGLDELRELESIKNINQLQLGELVDIKDAILDQGEIQATTNSTSSAVTSTVVSGRAPSGGGSGSVTAPSGGSVTTGGSNFNVSASPGGGGGGGSSAVVPIFEPVNTISASSGGSATGTTVNNFYPSTTGSASVALRTSGL